MTKDFTEFLLSITSTKHYRIYKYIKQRVSVDEMFANVIYWRPRILSPNQKLSWKLASAYWPVQQTFIAPETNLVAYEYLSKRINEQTWNAINASQMTSDNIDFRWLDKHRPATCTQITCGHLAQTEKGSMVYKPILMDWDSIEVAAGTFYLLQELAELKPKRNILSTRHYNNWKRAVKNYKMEFTNRLAKSLRDELAIMCFMEARHFHDHVKVPIDDEDYAAWLDIERLLQPFAYTNRDECADVAKRYSWDDVDDLIPIFAEFYWEHSFGGPKWATIAKRCLLYGNRSATTFCDSVFGLVHNGGTAFTKQHFFTTHNPQDFTAFLDYRQENELLFSSYMENFKAFPVETLAFWLAVDATKMGLTNLHWFPEWQVLEKFVPCGTLRLDTVDWGEAIL